MRRVRTRTRYVPAAYDHLCKILGGEGSKNTPLPRSGGEGSKNTPLPRSGGEGSKRGALPVDVTEAAAATLAAHLMRRLLERRPDVLDAFLLVRVEQRAAVGQQLRRRRRQHLVDDLQSIRTQRAAR